MNTQITLTASVEYNERYPPGNAAKAYVARITGRAKGSLKYEREFLGRSAALLAGDEGLYERQIGNKKGGHTRYYHVILSHPEHGLIQSADCEDLVPQIAKAIESASIADVVEVTNLRSSERTEGLMVFDAALRTVPTNPRETAIAEIRREAEAGGFLKRR